MNITILGAEGFVGKNLVETLSKTFNLKISDIHDIKKNNYVKTNVKNFDEVKTALKNTDVVIDLVTHNLSSSLNEIIENAETNIIGLINILEASRINGVKKILFPSASSLVGYAKDNLIKENHPTQPKTPYGITKLASEHYLRVYRELYGMNFVIFRFFNIYGPHQPKGLIPNVIFKLKKNESVTVFGQGNHIRDFVFVKDITLFFEKAISTNIADNKIINMGTGQGHTIMDIIKHVSNHLQVKPKIDFKPERPGEISNFVADTTLLKKTFNSVPSTSLKDGLEKTVEWCNTQQ